MENTIIPTPAAASKEVRNFRMDPNLLYSVIQSQAGTLNKAILESVMNSIDAGATRVDVILDRKSYKVTDDGKGFTQREQIEQFFETFGAPHVEGDATYGKFRMGRGQGMSFAKNDWRSGPFRMQVDIKGKGLDYTLETGLEFVQGCVIDGELYDPLEPSEKRRVELDLADQCLYTPIPVFLNGKPISKSAAAEKWTAETDDAFMLVNTSRSLALYNLGVLVANFPAYEFGTGGVVVSKKQLTLNFARNDVLRAKCDVWKAIRAELKKHLPKSEEDRPVKRDESWRQYQAREMMSLEGKSMEELRAMCNLPVFTDVKGKHYGLSQLADQARRMPIVVAPGKSLLADRVHDTALAIVLIPETFSNRFRATADDVFKYFNSMCKDSPFSDFSGFTGHVIDIREGLASFADVSKAIESDHHVVAPKDWPVDVKCAVAAVQSVQAYLAHAVSQSLGEDRTKSTRTLRVMKSESAEAYTDGKENIFINIKNLQGMKGPRNGIKWAHFMCTLVLHELCHDVDSGTGHTHDEDFYHVFHEASFECAFGTAVEKLFREWVEQSEKISKKGPSQGLSRQIDLDAKFQDRQEAENSPALLKLAA